MNGNDDMEFGRGTHIDTQLKSENVELRTEITKLQSALKGLHDDNVLMESQRSRSRSQSPDLSSPYQSHRSGEFQQSGRRATGGFITATELTSEANMYSSPRFNNDNLEYSDGSPSPSPGFRHNPREAFDEEKMYLSGSSLGYSKSEIRGRANYRDRGEDPLDVRYQHYLEDIQELERSKDDEFMTRYHEIEAGLERLRKDLSNSRVGRARGDELIRDAQVQLQEMRRERENEMLSPRTFDDSPINDQIDRIRPQDTNRISQELARSQDRLYQIYLDHSPHRRDQSPENEMTFKDLGADILEHHHENLKREMASLKNETESLRAKLSQTEEDVDQKAAVKSIEVDDQLRSGGPRDPEYQRNIDKPFSPKEFITPGGFSSIGRSPEDLKASITSPGSKGSLTDSIKNLKFDEVESHGSENRPFKQRLQEIKALASSKTNMKSPTADKTVSSFGLIDHSLEDMIPEDEQEINTTHDSKPSKPRTKKVSRSQSINKATSDRKRKLKPASSSHSILAARKRSDDANVSSSSLRRAKTSKHSTKAPKGLKKSSTAPSRIRSKLRKRVTSTRVNADTSSCEDDDEYKEETDFTTDDNKRDHSPVDDDVDVLEIVRKAAGRSSKRSADVERSLSAKKVKKVVKKGKKTKKGASLSRKGSRKALPPTTGQKIEERRRTTPRRDETEIVLEDEEGEVDLSHSLDEVEKSLLKLRDDVLKTQEQLKSKESSPRERRVLVSKQEDSAEVYDQITGGNRLVVKDTRELMGEKSKQVRSDKLEDTTGGDFYARERAEGRLKVRLTAPSGVDRQTRAREIYESISEEETVKINPSTSKPLKQSADEDTLNIESAARQDAITYSPLQSDPTYQSSLSPETKMEARQDQLEQDDLEQQQDSIEELYQDAQRQLERAGVRRAQDTSFSRKEMDKEESPEFGSMQSQDKVSEIQGRSRTATGEKIPEKLREIEKREQTTKEVKEYDRQVFTRKQDEENIAEVQQKRTNYTDKGETRAERGRATMKSSAKIRGTQQGAGQATNGHKTMKRLSVATTSDQSGKTIKPGYKDVTGDVRTPLKRSIERTGKLIQLQEYSQKLLKHKQTKLTPFQVEELGRVNPYEDKPPKKISAKLQGKKSKKGQVSYKNDPAYRLYDLQEEHRIEAERSRTPSKKNTLNSLSPGREASHSPWRSNSPFRDEPLSDDRAVPARYHSHREFTDDLLHRGYAAANVQKTPLYP